VNLPNYITLSRIAAIPLIIWVLTTPYFSGKSAKEETLRVVLASGIFILASITDGLDGYLARRRRQVTWLGQILDPIADKLLTSAAFISLVQLGLAPAWMTGIELQPELSTRKREERARL